MRDSTEMPVRSNRAAWENFWNGHPDSQTKRAQLPVVLDLADRLQPLWEGWLADAAGLDASRLDERNSSGLILELGCGARPLLVAGKFAPDRYVLQDGSDVALAEAGLLLPEAKILCADLADLSLPDACASIVVSQFGLEYGGAAAMAELCRVATDDCLLVAVMHKSAGAIDRVSLANKTTVEQFIECGVLALAPEFFKAAFDHHAGRIDDSHYLAVDAKFAPRLDRAKALLREQASDAVSFGSSAAATVTVNNLLRDMGELHADFGKYRLDDLLGWLAGWETELGQYVVRLQSMLDSALDETALTERLAQWAPAVAGEPLFSAIADDEGQDYGWLIRARKVH